MANRGISSFQKKVNQIKEIPGTKLSLQNMQLIVSTGVPTLDYFLGGGLTVGTILLIEEDKYGRYAKLLMKHFLAEGVTNNHSILLASGDESPKKILEDLPSLITQKKDSNASESVYENEMKIAWRYQNLPQFGKSSTGHQFCNQYNINTKMNHEVISKCSPTTIDISSENESPPEDNSQFLTASCFKIANRLQTMIKDGLFSTSQSCSQRNILRIAIHSLGSPYWKEEYSKERWETDILRFLYLLKSMMRSAFSVAVISVPVNLLQNHVLLERMRLICDTVIRLEGFDSAEGEIHPAFKDYKGLLHVVKVHHLNLLKPHKLDTDDLAFCFRKRSLIFEKFHLPPLLEEAASRSQDTNINKLQLGCSKNIKGRNIEF
ncbi:elongator complex protein 4-like [Centruroides sculpturatus]|uniref:elongator complex protein 4-like n=1 Tax=Centruroides sculpturatus TaxID=218467 RepID=UPI000C6CAEAD|nr:elongator complex protein 4-like [Centruroides sculpturatus]XP_023218827.1 elongator complex protein 4-like [Centruroides sculpturatus]